MNTTTCTLTTLILCLLSVSPHVAGAEADPARIDFTIRECNCGFVDKTSKGIFRWNGDVIEIRAPAPDDPRPTEFNEKAGETMRLVREGD